MASKLEFSVDQDACTRCGECARDCQAKVIALPDGGLPEVVEANAKFCVGCQHCLTVCKPGALSIAGFHPEKSRLIKDAFPTSDQMEALIKGRRTTRNYREEGLEPELIDRLLHVAGHAPTGKNNQGVTFTLAGDRAMMDKVRHATYEAVRRSLQSADPPAQIRRFAKVVEMWDESETDAVFRGAPHLLIATAPKEDATPSADCLIALSYFELYAATLGVGTVWAGLFGWIMDLLSDELFAALELPEGHLYGYAMAFGRPAVHYHRTAQRSAKVRMMSL